MREKISHSHVTVYLPEQCFDGYTLFTNYMGHVFYLIDMNGHVVHYWPVRTAKIGELLPNGNLIYGHMWHGMAETDWHGHELWYYPCSQHHDFAVMPNGHLMILCGARNETRFDQDIYKEGPHVIRYFVEVDPAKWEVVWRWDADDHIEELKKAGIGFPRTISDVYHSNTCEVLPETSLGRKDSRFKAGNVVFSHRNLNVIGVIEKESGEIVWTWGVETLDYQHMPTLILDTHPITGEPMPGAGHFLVFDNGPHRGYSKVVEIDPLTDEIVWQYVASTRSEFYGGYCAGADRMPNGNTVICEGGNGGRLFEVTREGKIVWEYLTPYLGFKGYRIYRCMRYPPNYVEKIIENPPPPSSNKKINHIM